MFSDPYRLNGRMNEILESMQQAWEEYQTDPHSRESDMDDGDYVMEMYEYKDEAKALAARSGLDQLDEADWTHDDGGTPRVSGDEDDYHFERSAADEIAAAWNTYRQIEQIVDQFPNVPDAVEDGPDLDGGRRYEVTRALKDQYDVSSLDELRQQYTDDDGEPLYDRKEFREQLTAIARTDLADEREDTDTQQPLRP